MGDTISNGYATVTDYPAIMIPRQEFQRIRLKASISANQKFYFSEIHNLDNGQRNTTPFEFPWFNMSGFHFMLTSFSGFQKVYLDYIRVWYTREVDPTGSVGDELANPFFVNVEPENTLLWSVFPNPAHETLQILLDDSRVLSDFVLLDLHGREIRRWAANERLLSLPDVPGGIYILLAEKDGVPLGRERIVLY